MAGGGSHRADHQARPQDCERLEKRENIMVSPAWKWMTQKT